MNLARSVCSARSNGCHYCQIVSVRIVSRHGVPTEILTDRGKAFLSSLMKEAIKILEIHQTNTLTYHPQTDGLVKQFNCALITMLAKTAKKGSCDWDVFCLLY